VGLHLHLGRFIAGVNASLEPRRPFRSKYDGGRDPENFLGRQVAAIRSQLKRRYFADFAIECFYRELSISIRNRFRAVARYCFKYVLGQSMASTKRLDSMPPRMTG